METARGRLLHGVRIAAGRVDLYRVVAPTDWNFHPAGVVAGALGALAAQTRSEDLARLASMLVESVDPCVDYRLEFV